MSKTLEEKQIVPQLRFPDFRKNWTAKRFDDLYYFLTTNSFSRNCLTSEKQTIQNIHYGDIHKKFNSSFDLSIEDAPYIKKSIETSKIKEENYCKKGDIIFADASEDYSDIGKAIEIINIDDQKLVAGLHTIHARPLDNSAKSFMANLLKTFSFRYQMMKNAQGTKVLGISSSRISNFTIYKPLEKKEQEKISSFLTAVDEKINLLRQKQDCLQTYKRGVMQKNFSQEIRFTQDDGTAFPDWKEKELNEVLEQEIRQIQKPNKNYLAIGIRSHMKGTFQKPDFDPSKIAMDKLFVVKSGDLIVNITFAWEGAIAIVKPEDDGGLVSHRFPTYLFKENLLNDYFKYVISDKRFKHTLDLISPGGAGRNRVLSKKDFLKIKWSFPEKDEQQKVANFLSAVDQKIDALNNKITQMETFKKGLLQKMFV